METREEPKKGRAPKILIDLFFIVLSALAMYIAKDFRPEPARFPMVSALLVFLFSSADLVVVLFLPEKKREIAIDFESTAKVDSHVALKRTFEIFTWFIGCGLLIFFLSFNVGLAVFVFMYVKIVGHYGWRFSLLMGAVGWTFLYGLFVRTLHLPFPPGLLFEWVGLNL